MASVSEAKEGGALRFYAASLCEASPSSVTATPCQLPLKGKPFSGYIYVLFSLQGYLFDPAAAAWLPPLGELAVERMRHRLRGLSPPRWLFHGPTEQPSVGKKPSPSAP